jgi:KDO2-lipid IV(A) lauroyltransferase
MYLISDGIYWLVYHVFRYRRTIVSGNLLLAFPEKSEKERIHIAKDFYRQFVDNFIENIKMFSISEKELNKRVTCNYEVMNDLLASGHNVQLQGGHMFSWEFINLGYCANTTYPFIAIYMPLSNKVMDRVMMKMRSRFHPILIPRDNFRYQFHQYARKRYILALIADQNPGDTKHAYWLPYFGTMAPFLAGPERSASLYNSTVVFSTYYQVKRGYYRSEMTVITTQPKGMPKGALTKLFRDYLEEQIRLRPSNYLWSHRRWKWKFDEEKYGKLVIE